MIKSGGSVARRAAVFAGILAVGACALLASVQPQQESASTVQPAGILKAADLGSLMPEQVFFRGQSATVQMRNSAGIRYADGMYTLAALVDTSGYSSGIQQRYQAYLITESALELGDGGGERRLPPGAYGVGFIQNNRFIVMDLGAHELLNVGSQHDAEIRRAMPLQIVDGSKSGEYRLYEGRSYIAMHRVP